MAAEEGWEAAAAQLEELSINGGAAGADGGPEDEGEPPAQPAAVVPAAAEAGQPCHVDHALRDALAHPRNRASVLRLEAEVEEFVLKSEEPQHVFSGDMSSYERLLAHRTAQHWGLETSTVNHGPDQGRILAIRTPSTRQPAVKLADVPVAVQEGPSGAGPAPANAGVGSPPAPRVLVRKRSDRMPSHRGGMMGPGVEGGYGMPGANGQYRSVQEREAEYHRARARIFGEGPGGPGGFPGMGPGGSVPPPPPGGRASGPGGPLNGGMAGGPAGSMGGMGGMATPFGGMMGPMGPQQMGAAMGYAGRPGMPGGMGMAYGGPPGGPGGAYSGGPGGFYGGPGGGYGGGGGGPRPTKAQLRNKEADMADPDFRRGRGMHAPRFDPGFGEDQAAASMYVRPSYGSEFPELASSGSSGGEGRGGGGRGCGGRADHAPASSPRSNGSGMGMGQPGPSQMPSSPAAAAMYAAGYGGQMDPQQMMAMQAAYGYGQAGMMPGAAMMAPMPGMVYPGAAAGGMPYGMVMQPYGYVPIRPGQEAMMQAYAASMQMAYAPYGSPGTAGMAMPVSPVSGMQNPLSPTGSGPLGRRPSGSSRYSGGRGGGGGGQRSAAATPRADSLSQDRQQAPAAAAAAAVAAAQAAQQPAAQQPAAQQPAAQQQPQQQPQQQEQPSGAA